MAASLLLLAPSVGAQESRQPIPANKANYKLANKFSSTFLRKFTYDSTVSPSWIGDSETFWYRFRTSEGRRYWLVDAVAKTKVTLFDHDRLAAMLSVECETPIDPEAISLSNIKFDDTGDEMSFSVKGKNFIYYRATEKLEKKEKGKDDEGDNARTQQSQRGSSRRRSQRGNSTSTKTLTDKQKAEAAKKRRERLLDQWWRALEEHDKKQKKKDGKEGESEEKKTEETDSRGRPRQDRGHRSAFSPDLDMHVVAKKNNLFIIKRKGGLQDFAKVEKPNQKAAVAAGKKDKKAVDGDMKTGKSPCGFSTDFMWSMMRCATSQ